MDNCEKKLRKVPECGIFDFSYKTQIIPEDTLVTTQAKREYLAHVWAQYKNASKELKTRILDEVSRNLGIHRKSAVRLLRRRYEPRSLQGFRGGRKSSYSKEAKEHLAWLWRQMCYMGPVRMKAALPEWITHDTHKNSTEIVRKEILRMSTSSIRRFLSKARAEYARRLNAGTHRGVKKFLAKVPIRNFEFTPKEPGYVEVDCVAHCGGSLSGEFAWTLTLTDIHTGWTECEAIWNKTSDAVYKALQLIEKRIPFRLKALYSDNGTEFMNETIIEKFAKVGRLKPLPIERGRPYRKNDQCYVEQKNYTHVRHLFGYSRINLKKSVQHMNTIYRKEWRDLQNLFLPQQKLISKLRIGSQIIRKMGPAETPMHRLIPFLNPVELRLMETRKSALNPFVLRNAQQSKLKQIMGYYKNTTRIREWGKLVV
jgi:hypothetical protein